MLHAVVVASGNLPVIFLFFLCKSLLESGSMALHRDIFWIGRQWAVTGFGMQAINQKHNGQFDIPVERLWDDDLPNGVRGQKWFNPDDFAKGLAIAQARHPKPRSR